MAPHPSRRHGVRGGGSGGEVLGGEQIGRRGRAVADATVGRGRLDRLLMRGLQGVGVGAAAEPYRVGGACDSTAARRLGARYLSAAGHGLTITVRFDTLWHCDQGGDEGGAFLFCDYELRYS
jgi:hypothetical protein